MGRSALLEAGVNVALVVALTWPVRERLRELAAAIPRRYVLFCLTSWLLFIGAQMASRGDVTYPLTDWSMYAKSMPTDPRFIDYIAELSSGREERLLIARLFPAGGKHLRGRIDNAAYDVERTRPGPEHEQAVANLDAMLAGVAREYRVVHPRDSVKVIRLWSATVPARNYKGPGSISRVLLREYRAP